MLIYIYDNDGGMMTMMMTMMMVTMMMITKMLSERE